MESSQGRLQITLLKELSGGTFARVYLAEAQGAGGIRRLVAVKVLRTEWAENQEFINRTKDEARMLSQLRHPNIVKVEDLAQLDGQLCLVMELVDGQDIQEILEALKQRGQRISSRAAYEIAGKVASALDAAWNKVPYGRDEPIRVVHRDIKPSNIMITAEGELKVLDFGTAHGQFKEREANTHMFRFGSLKYMSPERRLGDRGTHAGDIYSLGLMLMEMLQGTWLGLLPEPPDHAPAIQAAVQALTHTGMEAEDWDVAVRKVLRQMCADEPRHRPSAEQVTKLMRAFAGQAVGLSVDEWCHQVLGTLRGSTLDDETAGDLVGARLLIGGSSEPIPITTGPIPPIPEATSTGMSAEHPLFRLAPPENTQSTEEPLRPLPFARDEDATAILPIGEALGNDDATQILRGLPPMEDSDPRIPMAPPPAAPPPPGPPVWATAPPPPAPPPQAPPSWAPLPQAGGAETQVFSAGQPLERPAPKAPPPAPAIRGPTPDDPPPPVEPTEVKGGGCGKLFAVGCLVVLLLGLCLGCLGMGSTLLRSSSPGEAEPELAADPPPEVLGGFYVAVNVQGDNLQWTRLLDSAGQTVVKGDETGLEATVERGSYVLAVKAIGRQAAKADLRVEDDLTLFCALQTSGEVHCDGLTEPLVLVSN